MLVVLGIGGAVRSSVRLHPYASLHFNALVGGVSGARGSFDVAHYSETYREGFRWLQAEHPGAAVHIVGNGSALGSYFGWKYELGLNANRFEYFLSEVRQGWEKTLPGEVVHRIEREGVPLLEIRRVNPHTPAAVAYVRPWSGAEPPPAPSGREDPDWTRIEAREGAFDLQAALGGEPGYVALRLSATEAGSVPLIWRYYLGLRVWSPGALEYEGEVVPFQYRGTENFPSVMPISVSVADEPTWILTDVSRTRQQWSFGVYAPAENTLWHDAESDP